MFKFNDMSNVFEKPIIGQSLEEMEELLVSLNEKKFRGRQIFDWIYRKRVYDFSKMSDLTKTLREKLDSFKIHPLKLVKGDESGSKKTRKFLFQLSTGEKIESVLMEEGDRTTICLSTQVGCAVNCDFCATAKMGFIKNLSTGEIIDQFVQLKEISKKTITNVVFMGMGDPFLNYTSTIESAALLHHSKGINMAAWRITISTSGIINKINQYTIEKQPYKLAISLNATSQTQRLKTMPITKNQHFSKLLKVAKNYAYHTRKKVTFEYVLLKGINDQTSDGRELVKILNTTNCKLNIIPYNEIDGVYKRPNDDTINKFLGSLNNASFPVTIRWSKGQDIDAGCGQLATGLKNN